MEYRTELGTTLQIIQGHVFEWIHITPELAQTWLNTQIGNRKIRKSKVTCYAKKMANEQFGYVADQIAFDENKILVNGQHRLTAIIRHGRTMLMQVCWGASRISIDGIDGGIPKTLPDRLKMFRPDCKNRTAFAATVCCCANLTIGSNVIINGLNDFDPWYSAFKQGIDWVLSLVSDGSRMVKTAAVTGALAFAYKRNPIAIKEFGLKVIEGVDVTSRRGFYVNTLNNIS